MINRRSFLQAAALATFAFGRNKKRPNIALFLADDMGYADLGCYGSEVQTPNVDALARRGIRFRQFYNTARCCPTRASLLTGIYAHQAGVGHLTTDLGTPGYRGTLSENCVTIAEMLGDAGYGCYASGKWHVADLEHKQNWPLQRGFHEYFGTLAGGGNYFYPDQLLRGNEFIKPPQQGFYYTDAIGDHALRFLGQHKSTRPADPFLLYVPFTAPHWPLHALKPEIAKYREIFRAGWDETRAQRHRRQVSMGLLSEKWMPAPRDAAEPAWKDAPNKEWEIERMSVYAAQIDRLDQNVGRILKQVPDDTLILFLSDNGSAAEIIKDTPAEWRHTPFQVHGGNDPSIMPGPRDTFQSCGPSWAQVSNTPFRGYKKWVHEGGIATPLIVSWPGRVHKPGSLSDAPGHVIDLVPTLCEAAGVRYPATFKGRNITPAEGRSLIPAFEGRTREDHPRLFWEHEGNQAVREGRWKLVRVNNKPWELYDMTADRTELHDLALKQPALVARLSSEYGTWMRKVGALPWDQARAGAKQRASE